MTKRIGKDLTVAGEMLVTAADWSGELDAKHDRLVEWLREQKLAGVLLRRNENVVAMIESVPGIIHAATVPRNVPSTMYSRDVGAPVSAATGSMDSSLPTTLRFQPSGVVSVPGGADGTGPAGPPGGGGAALSAGGSANARGAAPIGTSMHTAAAVAKRCNISGISGRCLSYRLDPGGICHGECLSSRVYRQ